jgi:exodeoxyribonuclease-3
VLLRWLIEAQPDVVCLQELKAPEALFPAQLVRASGYEAVWRGQPRWNGVAILSRRDPPVLTRRALPGEPADAAARYIEAAVDGVLVGCVYAPNGNPAPGPKYDDKLAWYERLIAHAAWLIDQDIPAVLAGDFNIIPTEADVHKPERWTDDALFRPEARRAYARLLAQGWTDALRTCHPDAPRLFTFWDYFRNAYARDAGLRIDHVLLSPLLAEGLSAAEVEREVRGWPGASDHAPVWVEFELPPDGTPIRRPPKA